MKKDVEYLDLLMQSFLNATGKKNINVNSSEIFKEFREWLITRQQIKEEYIKLLEQLKIDFKSSKCVEIGKGIYDTIIKDDYLIKPISPYINGKFQRLKFVVIDGKPYYIHSYGLNNEKCICYDPSSDINTFVIQNPYYQAELNGFANLHNNNYNIVTGVYGDITDKDRVSKIKQIKELKQDLNNNNYLEEGIETNNSYCYVLASKRL